MVNALATAIQRHARVSRLMLGLALGAAAVTAGCGVTYNSPSVLSRNDDLPVSVVEMNIRSVNYANASHYTPRALPEAFYAVAGGYGSVTGAGALPAEPYLPSERRETLSLRPLPDVTPPRPTASAWATCCFWPRAAAAPRSSN